MHHGQVSGSIGANTKKTGVSDGKLAGEAVDQIKTHSKHNIDADQTQDLQIIGKKHPFCGKQLYKQIKPS
jgi:hypothetical protein